MKIERILSEHRNDFTAELVCEHCGGRQHLGSGYHDAYYHRSVIPAITCRGCGRNRAGDETTPNHDGFRTVCVDGAEP